MASGIAFVKYHGLGNDFVVVSDELEGDGEGAGPVAALLAPQCCHAISDRHFGIGADGVIFYRKININVTDCY
jgi:diaminopimelate epimerase